MKIRLIVAGCNASGVPCLMPIEVWATQLEYENGDHYGMAEYRLKMHNYEEPFVCIDELDAPEMVKLITDRPDKALHKALMALLAEFGEYLDAADDQYGRESNEAFQAAERAASHYQQTLKAKG